MEKYSVLMSVYYKEKPEYFEKSIQSMLEQTVKPDEIVIVKDGKLTNELDSVIEKYFSKYTDLFTVISLEQNSGLGHALNEGLKKCRNELVARMDTDDISLSDRCEKQLREFEKNKQLVICGGQICEFYGTTDNITSCRIVPSTPDEIRQFAKRRSPFNHPTVMYKKSKILSYNGYSENSRKEDLDLFLRMIFAGEPICNVCDVLLFYRAGIDNLQRRKSWKNCSEYICVMANFWKKGNIGLMDMTYIIVGQIVMFIMPSYVVNSLSMKYLRRRYN